MRSARIGWAAPWNINSAIGQSASEVAIELTRRGHTVTVLRTEVGADRDVPARDAPGTMHFLADCSDAMLRQEVDVVVGHIGDYYGFHGALLPRLEKIPIVGIFHDLCITHLIRGWLDDDQERLRTLVRSVYAGTPAAEAPFVWNDLSYVVKNHPMLEWAAARTMGAVVHEQHYAGVVERSCDGPIAVVPLAFEVLGLPLPPPPYHGGMTVAVVGHANSNKRIDQILLAIGASPFLRERCRVKIIGAAPDEVRNTLASRAATLGVSPPVFTGWVSDDDLRHQLRDVDVIGCLRYPILEGASASLIMALMSGRPTLVSDHGAYAAVPDDAVLKCAPGREARDIMFHLEDLARDPSAGLTIGERGRAFATPRHTASAYVDALEPLLERCIAERPLRSARQILTNTLSDIGLESDDPAVIRATGVIEALVRPARTAA